MNKEQRVFDKLKRNIPAMLGMFFLVFMALISLFAFFIIDDTTPDANAQNPEIALKPPGFHTEGLLIKSYNKSNDPGVIRYFMGSEKPYRFKPYKHIEKTAEGAILTSHLNIKESISSDELYQGEPGKETIRKSYWLGTDRYGRSIYSRLILGIRISLLVGLFAVVISLSVGIIIGSLGGYFGGWIDKVVMYLINVTWSIPTLLLVFAIVLAAGRGLWVIILAIGLTMWVDVARIVRGQVKKVREEQYVQAAISLGVKDGKILFKHILPNIIGPILVIGAANFATAILIEAGLSYLGFGVKPPTPSIGNMLNEHYGYAISGKPILALIPAVTIMLLVLALNILGSGLRDAFDVKSVDS